VYGIDWLTVYQEHPSGCPKFGKDLVTYIDLDTGETGREYVTGYQHPGSHDTSLRIRSDGRGVEVSGNPSRWCREDNIFGFQTVDQCLGVYNRVLGELGLPLFAADPRTYAVQTLSPKGRHHDTGPVIRRIDLTENFCVGSMNDARAFLRFLTSVAAHGRTGHIYPNGATVDWGTKSRYTYTKYYLKAVELEARKQTRSEYQKQIIEWCHDQGLVRFEVSFKSTFLRRYGLHDPARWTIGQAVELMGKYMHHRKVEYSRASTDDIREELIRLGFPAGRAERAQQAFYAWSSGHDLRRGMSKSAFYRLRSDLLNVGVDISEPVNVTALPVRIREVRLNEAAPPRWYRSVS